MQPAEVIPGVMVTGAVPRLTDYEETGGPFSEDEFCSRRSDLPDDQALFFETLQGVTIVLGCAHSGVVNTLAYVRRLTDGKPIHTVIGGMHLSGASPARLARTAEVFQDLGVKRIAAAHCTGLRAMTELWTALPNAFMPASVGTVFTG